MQTSLTIPVRKPGAWTARTGNLSPASSRCRWPRGRVTAASIGGHPPGARGRRMAPGWSLHRVRWRTASGRQGHVPGRSPSHADERERGTISGPKTLGVWGREMAMTGGVRVRRSTMATGTRASAAVILHESKSGVLDCGCRLSAVWTAVMVCRMKMMRHWSLEAVVSKDQPSVLASDASPVGLRDLEQPSALRLMLSPWCLSVTRGTQLRSSLGSIFWWIEEPAVGWGGASPIKTCILSCIVLKKASWQSFINAWTSGGALSTHM